MDSSKKILIVCYTFPPASGVGGRRWVKFSKYLNRSDLNVCVIAHELSDNSDSPWSKDASELLSKGKIIRVKNSYPNILNIGTPETIPQKVRYKLALRKIEKLAGNKFDRSTLWSKHLIPALETKIQEGYDTIIASAAPFRYLHDVCKLKAKFPQLKVITDFRDPWTNNTISYGFTKLNKARFDEEREIEQYVFEKADRIMCVDEIHVNYIHSRTDEHKAICIPNGFDPEDFSSQKKAEHNGTVRFVFAGSIYPKTEYVFKPLTDYLVKLASENYALFKRLKFDFYGTIPSTFKRYFEHPELLKTFQFHGKISLDEVGLQISSSHVAMIFLTEALNYTKSTKFYEYVHLKKKVAVFSSPGQLTDYVEDKEIGFGIHPENIAEQIPAVINEYDASRLAFPADYSAEAYSIPQLTEQLYDLVESLRAKPSA